MSAATSDAPSANNRRTQAAPMPLPAPVTKTVRFSKRFMAWLLIIICVASMDGVSAVDHERVAYHQACGGTAEPQNRAGNFLGTTKSADRHVFQHGVKDVCLATRHHPFGHRGMNEARTYGIDTNAPCGIFQSGGFGEGEYAVFGGLIRSS